VPELDERERREHSADEATEVAAHGDVRDREREREVEDDERHRLPREGARRDVLEDEQRAHDPEDRARGADRHGERPREQQRTRRAREPGDEVHEQEAPGAEGLLHDRAEPVEGQHVERDVQDPRVEEHRGDEAVPVAVQVDRRPDQGTVLEDLPARGVEARALVDGDEVDEHVDRHERDGRGRVETGDRALRLSNGARLGGGHAGSVARLHGGVLRALDPDRREVHALLADRAPALRARDERLAVGVPIAAGNRGGCHRDG